MHGATTSLRPRQRTFTSCTECRRRKQRCNQAKDRPCNNCSRRYPPVVCTYEGSSPPPSHDRIVDLRGVNSAARHDVTHIGGRTIGVPNPAYQQPPQSHGGGIPVTTSADSNYYNSSYSYYSGSGARNDYRTYQGDTSSAQYIATTTAGDYLPLDDGYYPNDQVNYGVAQGHDYYAGSDAQQGNWLATAGDPAAFVGVGHSDYFYVCEPEPEQPRTTRS